METANTNANLYTNKKTVADQIMFLVAVACTVVATLTVARLVLSTRTGTVDSYYYFARAAALNDGLSLKDTRINWGLEGVDRKFFPGYPLLLHWLSLGSQPDRVWRSASVLFVLLDSILLGFALRRIGLSFFAACAATAMFVSHPVPIRWMSMPMAEGGALFYLCLAAIALPVRDDDIKIAYPRFLISCLLGGMAILCRAEASYPAACIGLLGLAAFYKKPGWLIAAGAGMFMGIAPFAYWVSSLPPSTVAGQSRLHYVNEFFEMFSWRDVANDDQSRGGVIDNFARSWMHITYNWGRVPFIQARPESMAIRAVWIIFFGFGILAAALDLVGKQAQRFAIAFVGFIVFRSFWYYPYDRFLITGLPIAFAALALGAEWMLKQGRVWSIVGLTLVLFWVGRSTESYLHYHKLERVPENATHTYRDELETQRLQHEMDLQWYPVEGGDVCVLAARRLSRRFQSDPNNPNSKREDGVALEGPWPQLAYGLRPRPVILGYPFVNFWGDAEYKKRETVPVGPDGQPIRAPRPTYDFFKDKKIKYIITRQPRALSESKDERDPAFGTWLEFHGIPPERYQNIFTLDTIEERNQIMKVSGTDSEKYEWPRWFRVFQINYNQ
ncbi:MAG: hypothetical protein HY286_15925 [Planctomycetes bacterium]|nr:hypothetical protein [Planctomycetota bacterium]